jgi:hypothetical protein
MPDTLADALRRYYAAERALEDATWALLEAANASSKQEAAAADDSSPPIAGAEIRRSGAR